MIRIASSLALAVLVISIAAPAVADKETSIQLYKAGKRKYEMGEFDRSIMLFQQAYDEHPAPAYLYNIAQAYLKLENCPEALAHFQKFVAEKPDAPNRSEVDEQISALKVQCPKTEPIPEPVKVEPVVPEPTPAVVVAPTPSPEPATTGGVTKNTDVGSQRGPMVKASADVGIAFFSIGDVIVPVSPALRLAAAYPLEVAGLAVDPHLAIELQTMAYEHSDGSSTVLFTTALVGAAVTKEVAPSIRVGGDLGLGLFRFSGLKMGNPFIAAGAEQSGSVSAFALRVAPQAEYAIGNGLAAAVAPAYVIALGGSDLRDEISSISRLELMVGVRYRR